MWLINTTDYTLRRVLEAADRYPYAVLSHTWDESEDDPLHGEVDFHEIHDLIKARKKTGWVKIRQTCKLARMAGLRWAWIDTCCIDKSSSAELSEAINSMFRWYKEARVCFVWLSDLRADSRSPDARKASRNHLRDCLRGCRWFTRGWTLQELIAPPEVEFYDEAWTRRGTKSSWEGIIESLTGVDSAVLRDSEMLDSIPVARRMYWASRRQTTRCEDVAYSLLGIFGVNMPLIYGEGSKAFLRLQEMIIQVTSDCTLFAWRSEVDVEPSSKTLQVFHGVFADSPRDFSRSGDIVQMKQPAINDTDQFLSIHQGVAFKKILFAAEPHYCYMNLGCENRGRRSPPFGCAIVIAKTPIGYARVRLNTLNMRRELNFSCQGMWNGLFNLTIPKWISPLQSRRLESRLQHAFVFSAECHQHLELYLYPGLHKSEADARSFARNEVVHRWDPTNRTFLTGAMGEFAGVLSVFPIGINVLRGLIWPSSIKILCGFRDSSSTGGPDLEPWVTMAYEASGSIKPLNGIEFCRVSESLLALTNDPVSNEVSNVILLQNLNTAMAQRKHEPCTSVMVTPQVATSAVQKGRNSTAADLIATLTVGMHTTVLHGNTVHNVSVQLARYTRKGH